MAVPRNRHSNARKNSKRAHHAKEPKQIALCISCGEVRLPHRSCPKCHFYERSPTSNAARAASA